MRMWAITKLGKKASSSVQYADSEEKQVLNFMHEYRVASTEDVSTGLGLQSSRASNILGKLRSRGLLEELTRGEGGTGDGIPKE
jgi:predicted transcriptional regulator of viral defense system